MAFLFLQRLRRWASRCSNSAFARPKPGFLTEPLNRSGRPTGVYTVRIHAQEGTVMQRLAKE